MTNWNKLRDRAYKTACEHGWHDEDWSDEHLLCLIVCELMEAVEADRKGKKSHIMQFERGISYPKNDFKQVFDFCIKGSVEEELADVCIRLLDLSGLRGINLDSSINYTYFFNGSSFTEMVYDIVTYITNIDYPFGDRVYHAISQILSLADILNIDLLWFIEQKMKYNEMREYKHGCKY